MGHASIHPPTVRRISEDELPQLLALYRHLNADDLPLPPEEELAALWKSIYRDPNLYYIVADVEGAVVASCALAIVPNLTRGATPYAMIENVVTHPDFRRRGLGTAILQHAAEIARGRGCYKVMLMTGSKRERTLRFYERAGFEGNVKTGFIRRLI